MGKYIYGFTEVFLKLNRFALFFLIMFPIVLKFYSPPSHNYPAANQILENIGGICLVCWLFAVGYKANKKLASEGIDLRVSYYFNLLAVLIAGSYLTGVFKGVNASTVIAGLHINYTTPVYLPLIFLTSSLVLIIVAAKTLVSAELNREAGLAEYGATILLMLFFAIGMWYIQPRIKKL